MDKIRTVIWNLLLITFGSFLCGIGINGLLVPNQFISGGISGLALIVYYLAPVLPIGTLYLMFNIPLFFLGWRYVGRRFLVYSIIGMIIFSVMVSIPFPVLPVQEKILGPIGRHHCRHRCRDHSTIARIGRRI